MAGQFKILRFVSKLLNIIAGIAVTVMMLLTVADVLLRAGGIPSSGLTRSWPYHWRS
jgi:TRAP-type C4-dicarboxylate transport system permease small subunit